MNILPEWIGAARQLAMDRHHGDSSGHDPYHVERVVKLALQICTHETNAHKGLVELMAWLHDIDDRKLSKNEHHVSVEEFMREHQFPDELVHLIETELDALSYSSTIKGKKMTTVEGKIVQDADRLDAIGAIGIARVFAYGGSKGRPIDDLGASGESSLDHFYEKLFKLEGMMNTPYAQSIAHERTQFMHDFVQRLLDER